jgi:hypothetical protein
MKTTIHIFQAKCFLYGLQNALKAKYSNVLFEWAKRPYLVLYFAKIQLSANRKFGNKKIYISNNRLFHFHRTSIQRLFYI